MAIALWLAAFGAVLSYACGAPGPANIRIVHGDPASCPWRVTLLDRNGSREVCASGINITFESGTSSPVLGASGKVSGTPSSSTAEVTSLPMTQEQSTASAQTAHSVPDVLVPEDYVQLASGNYYKVFLRKKTWSNAQIRCQNDNANLVVLETLEEAIALRTYLAVNYDQLITEYEPYYYMHVGFRAKLLTDLGGVQRYERWGSSQPTEPFCVRMDNKMWLSYDSCSAWRPFVCEYDPNLEARVASLQGALKNVSHRTGSLQHKQPPTPWSGYHALPCCNGTYYKVFMPGEGRASSSGRETVAMQCQVDGAHLPIIDTESEAEDLTDFLLKSGNTESFYLGFKTEDTITVHGQPLSQIAYQRWESKDKRRACFVTDNMVSFTSVDCTPQYVITVCEINIDFEYRP